jgi:drug/metabolite transporter (DMT)-like permease
VDTPTAPHVSTRRGWLSGYLALAVIWGSSFLLIKVAIRELHPVYVTLGRVATGAVVLLALVVLGRHRLPRAPAVWGHLFVVALVGVAIPFTLFGYGEQRVSSVLAGIWNATTPLLTVPTTVFVFRTERLTRRGMAGVALGFAGVLTILGVWLGVGGSGLTGQLMCAGAACCYAVNIPYQRRFLAGRAESGTALVAGQLLLATAQLAIASPLLAGAPPALTRLAPDVVASVLTLGALGTGIAFVLNFRVIRLAGASTSASVTYLIPIFATLMGVAVLGESLSWYQPVGAVVVLVGVAVSQGVLGASRRSGRARQAVAEAAGTGDVSAPPPTSADAEPATS